MGTAVPASGGVGTGSGGGLSADTIVQLNNANSSPVSALQLTASLTTTTAGAETSKWLIKLLNAGSQVTALDIRPTQVLHPSGSSVAPGNAFQADTTAGFYYGNTIAVGNQPGVGLSINGGSRIIFSGFDGSILAGTGGIYFGNDQTVKMFRGGGAGLNYSIGSSGAHAFTVNSVQTLSMNVTGIGFYTHTPAAQQTITGSKGANAALASLLTALAATGLIVDSTT